MPKVTLTFKMPEEEQEMRTALEGGKYYSVLWELDQFCRSRVKYDENVPEEGKEAYEAVRGKMNSLMAENGLGF